MNINARNILTMQLSSLSVTIDLRHWKTLVHVSTLHTYKAASSEKLDALFLLTGPLTRPDGGQREGISGSRERDCWRAGWLPQRGRGG